MYEILEFIIGWTSKVPLNGYHSWIDHTTVSSSPFEQSWRCVPLSVCQTSQTLDHFVQYVNCSWRYSLF